MDTIRSILLEKGNTTHVTTPEVIVRSAVEQMCRAHIGGLLVMQETALLGVFSERDLMTRVVLAGRDPAATLVGEVMTPDVVCVNSGLSISEAMGLVTRRRVRHLPVMEGRRVLGLVSIGDLVRWQIRDFEQEIDHLRTYFAGYPV